MEERNLINTLTEAESQDNKEEDKKHFGASTEKRIKYVEDALKLNMNKLIRNSGRKVDVTEMLLKHWIIFDITTLRVGRITSKEKFSIILEKVRRQYEANRDH